MFFENEKWDYYYLSINFMLKYNLMKDKGGLLNEKGFLDELQNMLVFKEIEDCIY